jgi:hypothetical protein
LLILLSVALLKSWLLIVWCTTESVWTILTSFIPRVICFKKKMLTVSIFGKYASHSCERKLNTSFFDEIFSINSWMLTFSSLSGCGWRAMVSEKWSSVFLKEWIWLYLSCLTWLNTALISSTVSQSGNRFLSFTAARLRNSDDYK